jgi:hypothetical protein
MLNIMILILNLKSNDREKKLITIHMRVLGHRNGNGFPLSKEFVMRYCYKWMLQHVENILTASTLNITANKKSVTPRYATHDRSKGFRKRNRRPPNVFLGFIYHHSLLVLEPIEEPVG